MHSRASNLNRIGGELCLDFCNTVGGRRTLDADEYLRTYSDLIAWCQHAELCSFPTMQKLLRSANRRPAAAQQALNQALVLREAIYRVFSALAARQVTPAPALAQLNEWIAAAYAHRRLKIVGTQARWEWTGNADKLDRMLWEIAWSAADLLTSPQLALVRQCSGVDCTWLFLDTSKNHSRRWCDMNDCGNRAKARRHYARRKAAHQTKFEEL